MGTLAQLLKCAALLAGGSIEITLLQETFGIVHRLACAVQLAGRLHAILRQPLLELAEAVAQLALALP